MNKLIPIIAVISLLFAGGLYVLSDSDGADASYVENATTLNGSYTFPGSTLNYQGYVTVKSSNNTDIVIFAVDYSNHQLKVYNTMSYTNPQFTVYVTGSPQFITINWNWYGAIDPSIAYLYISTESPTERTISLSSTSGLSGGVQSVSVRSSATCTATITNAVHNHITITATGTGNFIDNWNCTVTYYALTFNPSTAGYGTVSTSSLNIMSGSTIYYTDNVVYINCPDSTSYTVTATATSSDAQYTYGFTGWSGVSSSATTITGDMTITANFSRVTNYYTVTVDKNNNFGTVSMDSVSVPYGTLFTALGTVLKVGTTNITATPNPQDAQYTCYFDGWDNVPESVTQNVTVTANFSAITNEYVVTIEPSDSNYGSVSLGSVTVPYGTAYSTSGTTLTIGSNTSIATVLPDTVEWNYSFDGWSSNSGTVSSAMTITANFSRVPQQVTVTINVNNPSYGSVNHDSVTVDYGSHMVVTGFGLQIGNVIVSRTPTPATVDTYYWFSNWSFPAGYQSGSDVYENITVTANFNSGPRYYVITYEPHPSEYGTLDIDYPVSPNAGYRASYGSTISVSDNVLTIDGEVDTTVTANPSAQDVEWTYAFDNWTIPSNTVTGDMTIYANFTRTANTVGTVTVSTPQGYFHEGDNAYTTHTFNVPLPCSISQDRQTGTLYLWNYEITADMTVLTPQYEYTFFIWNGVPIGGGTVTDGMTVTAVYHSEDRYYTVNFTVADGFGTVSDGTVEVLYNTLIYSENNRIMIGSDIITATPTPNTDDAIYEFISWSGVPMSGRILEDADIHANIQRTVTMTAFNVVEVEHGEVTREWSIPDELLPLMLVLPTMLIIGLLVLSLRRGTDEDDYDNY